MSDKRRPFPDLSKVRRVRIDGGEPTPQQRERELAERMAVAANADREREGDTE